MRWTAPTTGIRNVRFAASFDVLRRPLMAEAVEEVGDTNFYATIAPLS
jgi:hypothetical protein